MRGDNTSSDDDDDDDNEEGKRRRRKKKKNIDNDSHLNAIDLARDRTRNLGHRRPALYQLANQFDFWWISVQTYLRERLRENPGKNLNQVTCPDRDSNPDHLVSRPDALTVTPQVWTGTSITLRECISRVELQAAHAGIKPSVADSIPVTDEKIYVPSIETECCASPPSWVVVSGGHVPCRLESHHWCTSVDAKLPLRWKKLNGKVDDIDGGGDYGTYSYDVIRRYTNCSRILFHSYVKREREKGGGGGGGGGGGSAPRRPY
ncbi:hypothetical protein ANN_02262 [Periplaneta americana]|uniref:Uncharacterized protein n=1 Tax=Periplaneta americana TaxID=6978 RepID=A0ABQ8TXF9_PERAM|nr:hypothetical protein ANN_02262 [Periplaneta americana]